MEMSQGNFGVGKKEGQSKKCRREQKGICV